MSDATCMWEQCNRFGRIAVSVLRPGVGLAPHGAYCVPHAALRTRALRADADTEVWLDWARSSVRAASPDGGCLTPRRTRRRPRTGGTHPAPGGGPRLRGGGGPIDPFEWVT